MPASRLFTALSYVLWIAAPVLQVCVAVVLRRRKLDKEFPFFFKYLIFQVATNIVLLALIHHYRLYFYVYWPLRAISTILEFAIIYEIFGQLFRPYPYLRDFARVLLRWAGSLLVVIALLFALTSSANEVPVITAVMKAQESVNLVQCGLLFFLLWFCPYLAITRRHYLFGVALGFGVIASAELASFATRMFTGAVANQMFNLLLMSASDWAVAIWLVYFVSRAPASRPQTEMAAAAPVWEQGVSDLLYPHPDPEPSLLTRIDRLVEDAFAQQRAAKIAKEAQGPLHPPTPSQ